MKTINGFSCELKFVNGEVKYSVKYDDFSVFKYEDNQLTVCVQSSRKGIDIATIIAEKYKNNIQNFIPSRYTIGSFIIIDKSNTRVFIGRDRSQASHLYTYVKGDTLYISTDIQYFIGICNKLDSVSIDMSVINGVILVPFPLLKGVKTLLPGRYIKYDSTLKGEESVFWKIERVDVPQNYEEAVLRYGELLMKSVEDNISNGTATVFLSGGSDSAAVMGALNKIGVHNVFAAHMDIRNFYEIEGEDVRTLQNKYKFSLEYIRPQYKNIKEWSSYVKNSILKGSINSNFMTVPSYHLMGNYFSEVVPKGTTVFNGEMCILDQGFSESSDNTRNFRRWLFVKGGRTLAYKMKIAPDFVKVDWDKKRKPYFDKSKLSDIVFVLDCMSRTFLHSIGRPEEFFSGLKLGYMGMPGSFFGNSLLPKDYIAKVHSTSRNFFKEFSDDLCSEDWRMAMAMMSTCWYSESSNFTMPNDTASLGGLTMCFPFSSVDLMDFAASIPTEWAVDKKIQKDACKRVYDMPDSVAYRLKNHKTSFNYFEEIYGDMKKEIFDTVLNTDFGPLNENIKIMLERKMLGVRAFMLYCYALWIRNYGFTVE